MSSPIVNVIAGLYNPFDYESVTATDSATALTATKYYPVSGEAVRAFITAETAQCRYRYDGSDPTASEGHLLNSGDTLTLVGLGAISKFRAIRTGGTSAVLKVTYER